MALFLFCFVRSKLWIVLLHRDSCIVLTVEYISKFNHLDKRIFCFFKYEEDDGLISKYKSDLDELKMGCFLAKASEVLCRNFSQISRSFVLFKSNLNRLGRKGDMSSLTVAN